MAAIVKQKSNSIVIVVFISLILTIIILMIIAFYLLSGKEQIPIGEPEEPVILPPVEPTPYQAPFYNKYLNLNYRLEFRNEQCLFPNSTWKCRDSDPNMIFNIVFAGNGKVRLRHIQSGKCLYIDKDTLMLRSWDCWNDPGMEFVMVDAGDGKVRLKHNFSGMCLKPDKTDNGGDVRVVGCGDPGTEIVLIPA